MNTDKKINNGQNQLYIQFLGGAGTVTGSKFLLHIGSRKILVDCGLFQGIKSLREKNWKDLPIKASDIEAVILTHAHIDHSGYLPRLIKDGFKGKIYSTEATRDICSILLKDCAYLMEEDANYLNKTGNTKHHPALPLFGNRDVENTMTHFEIKNFNMTTDLGSNVSFKFLYVGHILGAASVVIRVNGIKIGFTGDAGRPNDPVLFDPSDMEEVDYLVTESTYGNRLHSREKIEKKLAEIINEAKESQGVILIPAFAIGRAMQVMYYLSELIKQNVIPPIPVFLNSPMAQDFSKIFFAHHELHKLSETQCESMTQMIQYVRSTEESKALNLMHGPMLIISASGMLTGGRILHHIKSFGGNPSTSIILTGFQPAGTRGEALQNGASELKIHGEYVKINAKIKQLDISAHADHGEMIQWFKRSRIRPKKVFLVHGEPSSTDEFRRRLFETFGWNCVIPQQNDQFVLE